MNDTFYFIDFSTETIQKKEYICIYILDYDKRVVFKIFRKYSDDIFDILSDLEKFQDITERVNFVIKRDGKLALDIKL